MFSLFFFFFLVQGVKPQFLPFKALLRPVERRSVQLGLTPTADPHWLCSSVNGNKIFNSHARKCKSLLHAALSKSLQVHDCCKNTTTTTTNKSNNNQQNKTKKPFSFLPRPFLQLPLIPYQKKKNNTIIIWSLKSHLGFTFSYCDIWYSSF